jgi:hypothetical protein
MLNWLEQTFADVHICIIITASLVGLASIITWSEFAYLHYTRTRSESVDTPHDSVLPDPRIGVGAGLGLFLFGWDPLLRFLCLVILAYVVVQVAAKIHFGREGSDEIALVIVLPLALSSMPASTVFIERLALAFIAAQLALAYIASASAKVIGEKWRDGRAIAQILSTRDYGIARRQLYHTNSLVFRALAWGTIAFEFALPLLFFLGGPLLIVALLSGIVFHTGVALTMGLNRFLPWFLSAYPAAAWASLHYGLLSH